MANLEKINSLYIKDASGNLVERYSIEDKDSKALAAKNEKKINELNTTIGKVDELIDDINGEPVFNEEGDDS